MRWQSAAERDTPPQPCGEFVEDFLAWARNVTATHTAFVAVKDAPVGMAWLARVPRSPGPGALHRVHGDLQTVYVAPEHRNQGIGGALVRTVLQYAWDHGVGSVTVSSGRRALPLYQRLGFSGHPRDLRIDASHS